ncbi:AraC family ligand binding domain-containing protein [Streptomyces scopuliridis]|uniref:AraC family ligand binding domain-containing protein n=1 Tax=Streptomyces scopuliridis TaxID=452529 RepID=UPI0036920C29
MQDESSVNYADPDIWLTLAAAASAHPPRVTPFASWVQCESGWAWRRRLPDFDLWAVTSGNGVARLAGKSIRVSAGTVLMLRPGDEVDIDQDENDRLHVGYCHYDYRNRPAARLLAPRVVSLTERRA